MRFFSQDIKNRIKNTVLSKHFRISFLSLFILTIIVLMIGTIVGVNGYVSSYKRSILDDANYIARIVQEYINSAEDKAYFIGNMKSVSDIFRNRHANLDSFITMIEDLSVFSNKSYQESIIVFFNELEKVYVADVGMYNYEEFYDKKLIDIVREAKIRDGWIYNNNYKRYYDQSSEILTYLHSVYINYINHSGYVAINIPIAEIHKLIDENKRNLTEDFIVSYGDILLYSSNLTERINNVSLEQLYEEYGNAGRSVIRSTNDTPVSCSVLVRKSVILSKLGLLLKNSLALLGLSIIAIFICSYTYSYILLKYMDTIMLRLGKTPYTDYRITEKKTENEFSLLGVAVESLNNQLQNLESTIRKNYVLIKEHLINELLFNQGQLNREEYKEFGIDFPYDNFAVIIISLPDINRIYNYTMKEQIKLLVKENATSVFSIFSKAYGTNGENENILFLINSELKYELLHEKIYEACRSIAQNLYDAFTLNLLFSVCLCTPGDPNPYSAYTLAKRNLIYTYPDNEEFIFFSNQSESIPTADNRLINGIARSILSKNEQSLRELLSSYNNMFLEASDVRQAKRLCGYCLCSVYIKLLETDMDLDENQLAGVLGKIDEAYSVEDCQEIMADYLYSLIETTNDKVSDKSYVYIRKAKDFIEANYQNITTVEQIADYISINSIYLNKIFKLSTGKTISEYLNYYRIDISKNMLLNSDMTIQEISEKIGYNDVRSYIRFFKKFVGVTPGKFRKSGKE